MSQNVIITDSGRHVRLPVGSGAFLPLRRTQFAAPGQRWRPAHDQRRPGELDILAPDARKLPFVERKDLMAELQAWLDATPDILVHALTGQAGLGKTRLAVEFCRAIDREPGGNGPWLAGFVSPLDLSAVVEPLTAGGAAWHRPILLVLDHAAQCAMALARWLDHLARGTPGAKLRILLLERDAPGGFGWWHDLTKPALPGGHTRLGLFHAPRPTKLPGLVGLEERRTLMATAFQAARTLRPEAPSIGSVPAHGADPAFDARIAEPEFGNPLSLAMAGVVSVDRGLRGAMALRRPDAARWLGGRELERLAALADAEDRNAMRHMVAFNGLAGGLPVGGLRETLAAELAASYPQADPAALLTLMQQELALVAEADRALQEARLDTTQPDLIGEAMIIEALAGEPAREAEIPAMVRRAYALGQDAAVRALVGLLQDYAGVLGPPAATVVEQAAGRHVLTWLLTLANEITDPERLLPLITALPLRTALFREAAADLTARVAHVFRDQATQSGDPAAAYEASAWIGHLAVRLGDLGRLEAALEAAGEAVQLHRTLAAARPDAFLPELAGSLSNLANMLGALGRLDPALQMAEEAARLYRSLAEAQPDAFTPYLAGALSALAARRSHLGQHGAALQAAEAAVERYRTLAEAHPDGFAHHLAASLDSLANALGHLGRHDAALVVAERAVQLHRALAAAQPGLFIPGLAASLNSLAATLNELGQRKAALTALDEAVRIRHSLAAARPELFTPDLASSLASLADTLGGLGELKAALAAAKKAVKLRRVLATARPDRFTPVLAASLFVLGELYAKTGDPELAFSTLREATERLTPAFVNDPAACGGLMTQLVKSYVSHCRTLGRDPDRMLLTPVLAVFDRLRSGA